MTELNLKTLMRDRRSVGVFRDEPMSLTLIQDLLDSAVFAPNHRLTEPWRFIIVAGTARETYSRIRADMVVDKMPNASDADKQQAADGTYQKFMAVPAYLIIAMQPAANAEVYEEDYAATACVAQNFLLLAAEQGLGTCWKTFKNDARLREFLGLNPSEKVVGIIHIGYSAEEPRAGQRQPVHSRLTILQGDS